MGDQLETYGKKPPRDMEKSFNSNLRAHQKGMSPEAVTGCYDKWSSDARYDEELTMGVVYNGPSIAADGVEECFSDNRDQIKILDVACGTGFVGDELYRRGFQNIDGLDPSAGMLKRCEKKPYYTILYQEYCGDNILPIADGVYDCLVVSGGMGEGHIPCSGLHEMIRIVKPGGYIIIAMRQEYLNYVEEYKDKLEPLMDRLVTEGALEKLERRVVQKYSFNLDGILFKFRVLQ